jgi:hypothetical protein
MRDLGIEKLANPLIGVNYRASLGSANSFNDCSPTSAPSNKWARTGRQHTPSRCRHFQSPRRPFSRLKGTTFTAQFPSAAWSGKRTLVRKNEGQGNGYGRHRNHILRRALPCTPPDVAGLFSAGYLTEHRRRGNDDVPGRCETRLPPRDQVAEARIDNGTRSSNKGFVGVLRLLLHRRHHLGSSSKSLRIPAAE